MFSAGAYPSVLWRFSESLKMNRASFFVVLLVAGCASNSGVVPLGPDTFMVSRQAATGFSGLGHLKADAMREAESYCARDGKKLRVVSTNESRPPYILANFPRAEVQFMCLAAGDVELTRPKPTPTHDVVVNANISSTSSAAPAATANVPAPISSTPTGADVYIDGNFVGNTPLPTFRLAPGPHRIEVKASGFSAWVRDILIAPDSPTSVTAVLVHPQ